MFRTPLALLCAAAALALAAPSARAQTPVDTTPPTDDTALPAPGGGGWYATDPVTVTLAATDDSGSATITYTLDGDVQTVPAGTQLQITGAGGHDLLHQACDPSGNCTASVPEHLDIDATAPADSTAPPAPGTGGWYSGGPVTVTLSATDGGSGVDSFEYRIDGDAPQSAADGQDVVVGGEGIRLFQHRARDVAGTWSEWVTDTIRIDTQPPSNDTAAVSGAWRAGSASIPVLGSDASSGVDHVEWRVDGGATQSGPSGSLATVSGDGTHTLETRVVDVAGNQSAWRSDTVKVDTVNPSDGTAVNAGWQPGPVDVAITGSDALSGVARVEWQLDGGAVQSSTTVPAPFTITAEGQHTLRTRVVDGAGNSSGWTDRTVRIDGTAPTNRTPVPDPAWRAGDYAVTLAASDTGSGVDQIEYRIDGSAPLKVPAGTTIGVGGTGPHTIETRAYDLAGNSSPWRSDAVNIDGLAPTDATAAIPAAPQPNPYTLTITGTDAHSGLDHVEWELDGGGVKTGPDGSEVTVSGAGAHTLRERVVDAAGNASGWRSGTVTIDPALNNDSTAPTDTTATAPSGWQTHAISLAVSGTDADSGLDHMEWRLDGRPLASGPSGTSVAITGDGVHHLETRAVDYAGNTTPWRAQVVRIDTTVPSDTTDAPGGWSRSRDVTVRGEDAASGVASVEWSVDGGATDSGPSGSVVTLPSDGTHTLAHRVLDVAGQASPWTTSTLKVDTVAPVDGTAALPSGWQAAAVTRALSGTDDRSGLDRMEWRLDGGAAQAGPVKVDADGTHTVETRAVDAAGNASAWRSSTVEVDVSAPRNTTAAAPAGWLRAPYHVTVTGDDGAGSGVARLEWRVGGGPIATTPAAVVDADGSYVLQTRVVDAVAHASPWRSETISIDRGAPAVALDCGSGAWRATAAGCAVSADGGPSGLAALAVARGGEAARAVPSGSGVTVDADGVWTVTATAVDGAGNRSSVSRTVRVDRTAPSASVSCRPSGRRWRCTPGAADATSGVVSVLRRVDGGAWRAVGGSFRVSHGTVEVRVADHAGLAATSAPVRLAARHQVKARTRDVAVSLRHSHGPEGFIGNLELRVQRDERGRTLAYVDLRPLAVGRGRYRTTVTLRSGDLRARRRRTVKVHRGGHTPRLRLALSKIRRPARADVTVQRRVKRGHPRHHHRYRWTTIARASAKARAPR